MIKSAVVLKQKVKEAVDRVEEEIETYTMLQTAKETQLQYSNNLEAYEGYLQNIWHDRVATPEGLQVEEILQSKKQIVSEKFTLQEQEIVNDNVAAREEEIKGTAALNIQRILEKVKKAETILEPLPALKTCTARGNRKRRRVETKQFTSGIIWSF